MLSYSRSVIFMRFLEVMISLLLVIMEGRTILHGTEFDKIHISYRFIRTTTFTMMFVPLSIRVQATFFANEYMGLNKATDHLHDLTSTCSDLLLWAPLTSVQKFRSGSPLQSFTFQKSSSSCPLFTPKERWIRELYILILGIFSYFLAGFLGLYHWLYFPHAHKLYENHKVFVMYSQNILAFVIVLILMIDVCVSAKKPKLSDDELEL